MDMSPFEIATLIFSVLLSITVHEFTHAKLADAAGDPTPRFFGRVTLNPAAHFDPYGLFFIFVVMFTGIGVGWGKPVPMNPSKMRNPRWDHFWAVFGAPLSNLGMAILAAILLKLMVFALGSSIPIEPYLILQTFISVNVTLFLFNLLPIGPLDGMWVFGTFLPEKTRYYWTKFNLSYGQFIFIGLIIFGKGIIWSVLAPMYSFIFRVLDLPF